jgi:hypothetical protein
MEEEIIIFLRIFLGGNIMNAEKSREGVPYILNFINEDFDGININLLVLTSDYEGKGIAVSGLANLLSTYTGVSASGIVNYIPENKGLSVSPINYSKNAKDILLRAGLINIVNEEPDKDTYVVQLGLYNRIGGRTSPIINFKNLFKKKQSKDKSTLEDSLITHSDVDGIDKKST